MPDHSNTVNQGTSVPKKTASSVVHKSPRSAISQETELAQTQYTIVVPGKPPPPVPRGALPHFGVAQVGFGFALAVGITMYREHSVFVTAQAISFVWLLVNKFLPWK
jgi:hypothetical protein